MLKELLTDKEVMNSIALIGRLGLNIIISLLIFFLPALYIDNLLNAGYIILTAGILMGIISGVYLNYRQLKKYYENKPDKD